MKEFFKKLCSDASLVGASYLVFNKGKIVEKVNYGVSDLETGKKVTNNTVFRIASVSKILVALCIMRLYEENKLDLDADISEYLGFKVRNPKYPNEIINLKMVLTQTSSITDGLEFAEGDEKDSGYNSINGTNIDCSLQDLLDPNGKYFVKETYSNYNPGSHFQYSNLGCGILACVVEKVTGKYFTEYIKDIIFRPLKLDASFVVSDIKSKDVASTYIMKNGEHVKLRDRELFEKGVYKLFPLGDNFRGPAGGCFISTNGLMKIMQTLLDGGAPIIKEETLHRMMQMTWAGKTGAYESYSAKGLQLMITDYFDNRRLWGHFGDAYGVKSHFLFNKKEQFGMVFITNGGGYKYQECGYSDVQEKLIKETLDKYWAPEVASTFRFNINEKIGYLLDRKIEIKTRVSKGVVYISKLSIYDAFGISTLDDYDYVNKASRIASLDEILDHLKDKYDFDILKGDDSYMVSYRHQ